MEKAGLVERMMDPEDRRSVRLRTTKKGEFFFNKDVNLRVDLIKHIMDCLTEDEVTQLIQILGKLRFQALRFLHQEKDLKEIYVDASDPVAQCLSKSAKKKCRQPITNKR